MNPTLQSILRLVHWSDKEGGTENLRSYVVAEAVYDATVVFCNRFIDKTSRTHDQMIQAARSGVRNISEGSGAAATSKKMEMKLTNVARASLNDELAKDYKSYLVQNGLRLWHKDSRECLAMRERLKHDVFPNLPTTKSKDQVILTGLAGLADFVKRAEPELAERSVDWLRLSRKASALLSAPLPTRHRRHFKRERLHTARTQARAEKTGTPLRPLCGKPMRRRTAGKTNRQFWGCPAYPNCKGTQDIEA
jgi:restriction system protein